MDPLLGVAAVGAGASRVGCHRFLDDLPKEVVADEGELTVLAGRASVPPAPPPEPEGLGDA